MRGEGEYLLWYIHGPQLGDCTRREYSQTQQVSSIQNRRAAAAQPSTIVLFHCDSSCKHVWGSSTRGRIVQFHVLGNIIINCRNFYNFSRTYPCQNVIRVVNHPEEKWFHSGENKEEGNDDIARAESFSVSSFSERRRRGSQCPSDGRGWPMTKSDMDTRICEWRRHTRISSVLGWYLFGFVLSITKLARFHLSINSPVELSKKKSRSPTLHTHFEKGATRRRRPAATSSAPLAQGHRRDIAA